jgi:DNA-binding Lrp family transcriptional regulator
VSEFEDHWVAWLNELEASDAPFGLLHQQAPPRDPLIRQQVREVVIRILKGKQFNSPARIADEWLRSRSDTSPPGGGGPESRAPVHKAPKLAYEADILGKLIAELRALGHVGEERACKLVYLSVTSRLFEKPVSLVAKGLSAGGKSATIDRVLLFVPDEATFSLSGMSEKFMVYDDQPIEHKMLVLHEAVGMSSEYASYLIRTLLSEGCLRHGTVEATADGLKPVRIERKGPAGLITSTTQISLHAENETRLISVPIDDSPAQTALVLDAIAATNGWMPELEPWHQLQYWLADGERRVVVPFARVLAKLIPPVAVRLRRDFGAVLGLTRAHALLHRASRDVDEHGEIVATLDDYDAVRKLVHDLISDSIGAQVSEATRETVEVVADITAPEKVYSATTAQIVERLNIDKSAVSRRISKAIEQGYLVNEEIRPRQSRRLRLGDPLPENQVILPLRETVETDWCTSAVGSDPPHPPPPRPRPRPGRKAG